MSKIENILPFLPSDAPAWVAEVAGRYPSAFADARKNFFPQPSKICDAATLAGRWSDTFFNSLGSNCAGGKFFQRRVKIALHDCLPSGYVDAPFLSGYRLLDRGRHLLDGIAQSVCCCGTAKIPVESIQSVVSAGDGVASISGLVRCKNSWVCPVCAPRLADRRATALIRAVPIGHKSRLVTLTAPSSPLVYGAMKKLFAAIKSSTAKLLSARSRFGKSAKENGISWARSFDETFSLVSGFHPHLHIALFFPEDCEVASSEIASDLVADWLSLLTDCGYPPSVEGQHVGDTSYSVAETAIYVCGAKNESDDKRTKDKRKQLGVFALMSIAAQPKIGCRQNVAADVFQAFAKIVKGCRRFSYCRALKLDLSVGASFPPLEDRVLVLGEEAVKFLAAHDYITNLLSVVAAHDDPWARRDHAANFLRVLGVDDYALLPPDHSRGSRDYLAGSGVIVVAQRRRPGMLPDIVTDWDMYEAGLLAA